MAGQCRCTSVNCLAKKDELTRQVLKLQHNIGTKICKIIGIEEPYHLATLRFEKLDIIKQLPFQRWHSEKVSGSFLNIQNFLFRYDS